MTPTRKTSHGKSGSGRSKETAKKAAASKKAASKPSAKGARGKASEKPAPAPPERRPTLRKAPTAKKTAVKKAAKRAVARRRDTTPARPPEPVEAPAGTGQSKLGTKFTCFRCQLKFYDLGRPTPICPKCGANQQERPAVVKTPKPAVPAAKRAVKAMAPLLDDEEEERVPEDDAESAALGLDLADVPADGDDILDEEIGDEVDDAAEDDEEEEI